MNTTDTAIKWLSELQPSLARTLTAMTLPGLGTRSIVGSVVNVLMAGKSFRLLTNFRRIRSVVALCLLVSIVTFSFACQEKLPMSVEEVWRHAGGDANKLGEVINEGRQQELENLHRAFERETQGGVPGARMWFVYAEKAQKIESDYGKLKDEVFDDLKNRSN